MYRLTVIKSITTDKVGNSANDAKMEILQLIVTAMSR